MHNFKNHRHLSQRVIFFQFFEIQAYKTSNLMSWGLAFEEGFA